MDSLIKDLMTNNSPKLPDQALLRSVCQEATKQFKNQQVCLELASPLTIVGDIHGQLKDLQKIFRKFGKPPQTPFLFLGDYVDRGECSLEVILLLLCLKIKHPYHIFLLRGNHECSMVNEHYGFKKECERKLKGGGGSQVWKEINAVFQWMPLSAIIEDKILCLHGGLSPGLKTLSQLKAIKRDNLLNIPDTGLVCDMLWSDPDREAPGGDQWAPSDRGVSFVFNPRSVEEFCTRNDLDLICRAHEVKDEGYEFFCNRKLVTVFSAPNYCGTSGNEGAVLTVDPNMNCDIHRI